MKNRYKIIHTETLVGHYEIEANSEQEAVYEFCKRCANGEIDFSDLELVNGENVAVLDENVIANVRVGDRVVCFDEYLHDYVEHLIEVDSIEIDDENGIVLYGEDLSDDNIESMIGRVDAGNFVRIYKQGDSDV